MNIYIDTHIYIENLGCVNVNDRLDLLRMTLKLS